MNSRYSVLFFGSSANSVIVLKSLLKSGYQPQITTTPAKPSGRNRQLTPNPITQFCQSHHLPSSTFDPSGRHTQTLNIDLIISADFGLLIPDKTLNLARLGTLNLHPSLLPKFRGPAPVPWAILSGETQTGVSIIEMASKFDQGPLVAQQTITIKPTDTSATLLNRCYALGAKLLNQALPLYINFKTTNQPPSEHKLSSKIKLFLPPKPQPKKSPTPYARKFSKKDGFVTWKNFKKSLNNRGKSIHDQVRALTPWPGVYTTLPNHKNLKIRSSKLIKDRLLPVQVQLESKTPIIWQQFLTGYKHLLQ